VWATRKRGNSSLDAGTRIRDDRLEMVGSGTEKISSLDVKNDDGG
jgi:hypothetical protein